MYIVTSRDEVLGRCETDFTYLHIGQCACLITYTEPTITFSITNLSVKGPRGTIKKVVRFSQISANAFNLAFGDLDEKTGDISDTVVTNNDDSRKVLATVAATVYDFSLQYPGVWIVAKGRTQ